uniref:Uncharacterized protein n=1 Tax=Chromera velia CCMP2878 TaxID=1169474 RepID=A0A0G4I7R4_9ALVE|eukprot:Cvel_11759.t1-p1 / transcript=Cvel_11759.t1 / gene=Cvel_11759 / organism=Chromera_velia_CCMP2878 / gene_product=Ankyrin repeat domain-containing protein 17, putative / transcript_product=Ankyrin repeat domain-containing protein 17, putative / location=Cvel_scaffold747:37575-41110(+) / protein_length=922 / sequence_SO=supercontig / SO=protein_coding / is_pseudo=false
MTFTPLHESPKTEVATFPSSNPYKVLEMKPFSRPGERRKLHASSTGNLGGVKEVQREWLDAAAQGNVEMLKMGADLWPELVGVKDENGESALFKAAACNRTKTLAFLLDSLGASVDPQRRDGRTALMQSALRGNVDCVMLLVAAGARVDSKTPKGVTALMLAAFSGHTRIAALLMSASGDRRYVNAKKDSGFTALMVAAQNGHSDVVELLLRAEAEVNSRAEDGVTALILAAQGGHLEAASMLLKRNADATAAEKKGFTALMFAAQNGHPEFVALLLRESAGGRVTVNVREAKGYTALMFAAMNGHSEVVSLLIRERADVNAKEEDGWTALMFASQNGYPEVAALLIQAKADVNAKEKEGWTPIMFASRTGPEVVGMLIQAGAEVSARTTRDGLTALILAARSGNPSVVALLLQAGTDPSITLQDGTTAASLAAAGGHQTVRAMLEGQSLSVHVPDAWVDVQRAEWNPILDLVKDSAVALWSLPVLCLLLENRRCIPKRQDVRDVLLELGMEEKQIHSALHGQLQNVQTNFPLLGGYTVVCLSFCWLSKDHPDPNMFHLRLLVEELKKQWWAQGESAQHVYVFWDFMSLFQKPRSESEDALFRKALTRLDVLYSSFHTRVFRSTGVPPESLNPLPFESRGWPAFETCVTGFKPSRLIHHLPTVLPGESQSVAHPKSDTPEPRKGQSILESPLSPHPTERRTVVPLTQQPVVPPHSTEDFDRMLMTKTFTNGADSEMVKHLYRNFIHLTARNVCVISFASRSKFTDEHAAVLCGLFRYLLSPQSWRSEGGDGEPGDFGMRLEQLDLSGTSLTDKAAVMLIQTLSNVKSLKALNLKHTNVSIGTIKALHQCIEGEGFPSLGRIGLFGCRRLGEEMGDKEVSMILGMTEKRKSAGQSLVFDLQYAVSGLSDQALFLLQERLSILL